MQYWNEILPRELKNQTTWTVNNKTPPPILNPNYNPENHRNNRIWSIGKINRPPFSSRLPPPPYTTPEPLYGLIKTRPSDREKDKEDMQGIRNVEYGTVVTAAPSLDDNVQLGTAMNIVIIIGALFLIVNVLVFAGLYYKRTRLKVEERNLKRQYEDMQNANLDIDSGGNTLREKAPLAPLPVPETPPEGCNVIKMIRNSTKSEDTYEAVKASEGSSNQRFKLSRQISSSTLDPHTKVRDWIAHEIVQRCSPRFLRRTRQQFALEHKQKESLNKSNKTNKGTSRGTTTINTNSTTGQPPTRPVSPGCKNSSTSSQHKPKKISVAIDATADARSSSVLKQQPIEFSKSFDSANPPAPGRMRRSATLEDFTVDEKLRPPLKRQNSINEMPVSRDIRGEEQIIKINHQHSRSDPVDMTYPRAHPSQSPPKLSTFDANQDINVTCKDEHSRNHLSPEEALQTIKRRNFPKVLPDFPSEPNYNSSMKRRSLPSHNLLSLSSLPENRAATMDHQQNNKIYSRIPPAPPPRTSSTLGRKPSNATAIASQMSPVRLAEEPPVEPEPTITSNTLIVGPLIPSRAPLRKPEMIQCPSQPIYDNLRSGHKEELIVRPKNFPKTIISADQDHPVKRVEPKVIIKPNTSSMRRDPTKVNKVIPRVVAKDNSVDEITESLSRQNSVPQSPSTSVPTTPTLTSMPPIPPPFPTSTLTQSPSTSSDKSNADTSSSDSSTSTSSDTGTVVKRQ